MRFRITRVYLVVFCDQIASFVVVSLVHCFEISNSLNRSTTYSYQ